jgi:MFS superfamily sulfate permease-like transporter
VLDLVRRQYSPRDFIIRPDGHGGVVYEQAVTGGESLPGLIIFRYDAQLFYANANRFVDDAEAIVEAAPDPVRWFVLDAGSIDDVDYSAGISLGRLLDYLSSRTITFGLARLDESLSTTLGMYGLLDRIPTDHRFSTLEEALAAFRADTAAGSRASS